MCIRDRITRLYDKTFARDVLPKGERANVFQMFEDKPLDNDAWDIDIFYQEIITLFGTVTVECLFVCQLVYCLMHGFDGSLRQRAGYISDTQADKVRFGMRDFECIYLFGGQCLRLLPVLPFVAWFSCPTGLDNP